MIRRRFLSLLLTALLVCLPISAGRNFDGLDDKIDCGSDASLNNLTVFTAWVWFRYGGTPSASGNHYIISKNGVDRVYLHFVDTGGDLNQLRGFVNRATAGTAYLSVNDVFSDNIWTFAAATFDDSRGNDQRFDLFVGTTPDNLAEVSYSTTDEGSGAINDDSAGNLIIGSRTTDNDRVFIGDLANVGLVGSVLSLSELKGLMVRSAPTRVVAGFWPLWGVASPEPDLSGNGNNGTVTGAVLADHCPCGPYIRGR